MAKTQSYLLVLTLLTGFSVYSADKKESEKVIEIDPKKMEEHLNKKSQFSTTSSDQKAIDETLEKNQEKFDDQVFTHMEKSEECVKKGNVEEVKKCRIDYLKNRKK